MPIQQHRPFQHGLELADVAGPGVGGEPGQRAVRHALDGHAVAGSDCAADVLDEERQVVQPVPQRRHHEDNAPQGVVEIRAESLRADGLDQVSASCDDEPDHRTGQNRGMASGLV
jgi:hypothetical protein